MFRRLGRTLTVTVFLMSLLAPLINRTAITSFLRPITRQATVRAMHIQSIPMWEGTGNNYAYLVTDDQSKEAVIIDPANPPEVLPVLKEKSDSGAIKLSKIINTHHHHDHAGGNVEILKSFPLPIIGGKDCSKVTETPSHTSTFNIGSIKVTALHTPCHTQDSICFFFEDGSDKAVFTGDTLFIGGCGRFFEGNAAEMHKALNETLAGLPDDTKVYPGHEYTKGNVLFAKKVLDNDAAIRKLEEYSNANKETQGKFTIGDEKQHNVFMRVNDPDIQQLVGEDQPVEVMRTLRQMKDRS
ncbi:hydroxyacylglutathione hydrolase [Lophiostoma macrostomum CBS 122681]|uniref:hydroxyacylglutathione hydrolase n=1 Tax=Lophiostoma macrostomum CBS 122681 TaxID=1314788 RepID=A0A6A6TFW4_9PLEO|nr:hydroxyacylglutathione hydrolase [Lophiostoma macrostomum CBS 122681]